MLFRSQKRRASFWDPHASQSRKPLTRPENASTECDACLRPDLTTARRACHAHRPTGSRAGLADENEGRYNGREDPRSIFQDIRQNAFAFGYTRARTNDGAAEMQEGEVQSGVALPADTQPA